MKYLNTPSFEVKTKKQVEVLAKAILQPDIYIEETEKLALFKEMLKSTKEEQKYLLSAENLEKYCKGKTHLPDYAYSKLRAKLKVEFKVWKDTTYKKWKDIMEND